MGTLFHRLPTSVLVGGSVVVFLLVAAVAVVITVLFAGENQQGNGSSVGDLQTIDVRNITLQVPASWQILERGPDTIRVLAPPGNAMVVRSGRADSALSLEDVQQLLYAKYGDVAPDARLCGGPASAAVPGVALEGRYFAVCYTSVPQGGGRAARLSDAYYVAVDAAVIFVLQLTAAPEALEGFAALVRALPEPQWKLVSQ